MVGRRKMGRHIEKNHSNVRRFKCEVCQKGFHNSTALKEHINTHTGEKPFKCAFCTACFASRGTKAMHQRSHLGYKRKSKHWNKSHFVFTNLNTEPPVIVSPAKKIWILLTIFLFFKDFLDTDETKLWNFWIYLFGFFYSNLC